MNYIKINQKGYITGIGTTTATLSDIPLIPGETALEVEQIPEHYGAHILLYRDGAAVDTGQSVFPPHLGWVWDDASLSWIDGRTLAELKAAKWEEIKDARSVAEYGGFVWEDSVFDSDPSSQQKIIGASQMASLNPATFLIDWTLADNSVRTLNATEMNAVGVALGEHVNAQYVHARELRQQIEAATTKEQVALIHW
jgi:hypothetical protein